jgi:hypothetical protein
MEADDPDAQKYLTPDNVNRFAAATAMYRFYDLLHRNDYRPVAAIRFHRLGESFVRVYFQQLHETSFERRADVEGVRASDGVLAGAT